MSNITDQATDPSEHAIALFLQENDMDKLTDALVDALYEALRIMDDGLDGDRLH